MTLETDTPILIPLEIDYHILTIAGVPHEEYNPIPIKFKTQKFRVYNEGYCDCPCCEGHCPTGKYHYETREVAIGWKRNRNGKIIKKRTWVDCKPRPLLTGLMPRVTNLGKTTDYNKKEAIA